MKGPTVQDGITVLLTGATGAFGSNILAALLSNQEVSRVYAISRESSEAPVRDRLVAAFKREGFHQDLLQLAKLELFEGDMSRSDFGLSADDFAGLRATTTHIIHNGE